MPFLTIGSLTIEVVAEGATESPPVLVGERGRTAAGRDGGWIRADFPVRRFTTFELTTAQWDALVSATPAGRVVSCSGDALGGPGEHLVRRSGAIRWDRTAQAARYVAELTLEQV